MKRLAPSHSTAQRHHSGVSRHALPLLLMLGGTVLALALTVDGLRDILPPALWWSALTAPSNANIQTIVFHDSWLPRLLMSWLCGAALGLAGTIFQQVLRNPLAEPMTLGISAGAQLALGIATLWAPALLGDGQQWIALGGALLAAGVVFGLSWRSGLAPATVVVAGLVVTLFCGSVGVALQLFYAPYLRGLFIWGGGSLVQQDWHGVATLLPRLVLCAVLALLLLRPMTLFGLDDTNARSLGLSLRRMRLAAIALAVVLSAAVVSAVGVIGFVGLAAPALAQLAGARRLLHRLLFAPLCGALVLWLTDQIVQRLSGMMGDLIPTGAATALFGAPLMLMLLSKMRKPHASVATLGTGETDTRLLPATTVRRRGLLIALALLVALGLAIDFGKGPHGWVFSTLSDLSHLAIWRVPRTVSAFAAGILLALAGTSIQRLTGNPLASPEVLGVSAGAALGLILLVLGFADAGPFSRLGATGLGAFGALFAVLWFARRSHFAPDRVLLAGIAIGALFQAVVAIVIASGGDRATTLLAWLSGSTYTVGPQDAVLALIFCVLSCAAMPFCHRWLEILPLGEASARAIGVDTRRARLSLLCLIALQTAAATLIVGPFSFVGLTAPHFARLLGARRPLAQWLLAAPIGALTIVLADWVGRVALLPRELPAGLIATLIGAPYLIWLIGRRR